MSQKLTTGQRRALDEWKRRMGSVSYEPHYPLAVFSERSNAEAALRRSLDALVKRGVFQELPDHRVQLVESKATACDTTMNDRRGNRPPRERCAA